MAAADDRFKVTAEGAMGSVVSEPRSFAKRSDSESKRTCGVRGRQDRVRGHRRKPESFEGKAHSTVVSVITEARWACER